MPLDTSIPAQAQTMQINPLQLLGQVNQIKQAQLQRQALQQQIGANQAASLAIQGNTDPSGNVNVPGALGALAKNPASAYNLPEVATKLYQMQGAQYGAQNAKLEGVQKQIGYWDSQLGGLLQKGNGVTKGDVVNSLSGGLSSGMISSDQAVQYLKELPQDDKDLPGWVQNHWVSLQDAKQQAGLLLPQGQTVNTGGQTAFINRDPLTGQVSQAGAINNTLTPGELAANVDTVDPTTGAHYAITKAQQLAGGGAPGAAPTGGYNGRLNAGGQAGTAPGVQTALGPGQQAAMTAQGGTSNTAAQTLHDAAADAPMRLNLLGTARDALSNITTGPGTDWRNTLASALQSTPGVGDALKAMGVTDPTKIASYDEYKKILTNYASSVSGSLGTGTDARLNAAVTGNANPGISNIANEDILTKTIAAEKMRQAQDYAFQNSGLTTDQFNKWQSQWNRAVNPDAFAFTSMTPAQQQSFIKRQSPQQLAKFKGDLGNLVRSGVIQMPGGQ
jgi:hypothetical protein